MVLRRLLFDECFVRKGDFSVVQKVISLDYTHSVFMGTQINQCSYVEQNEARTFPHVVVTVQFYVYFT